MSNPSLDRLALGRALTRIANADALELARRASRPASTHIARRVGVTGAPGAGKSTLLGHLALRRVTRSRIGVLAVDPSSPKSGGAILGDRIRMDELAGAGDLYIRSLGSRHASDGLADNLPEMLEVMDDFGFDEVLLETVGVGQAEYAARLHVDTLVLVLLPDSGDTVQAMKAGIMEMADIFVINKADLAGAHKMAADIQRIAAIMHRETRGAWNPPVLLVTHAKPESVEALSRAIDEHQAWLGLENRRAVLRDQRARYRLRHLLDLLSANFIARQDHAFFDQPVERQMEELLAQLRALTSARAG